MEKMIKPNILELDNPSKYLDMSDKRIKEILGDRFNDILNEFNEKADVFKAFNKVIDKAQHLFQLFNPIMIKNTKNIEETKNSKIFSGKRIGSALDITQSRTQEEIDGLNKAIDEIYNSNFDISISTIKYLHNKFKNYDFRTTEQIIWVVEEYSIEPYIFNVAPEVVDYYINLLVDSFNNNCDWELNGINLIRFVIFIYHFLSIHPFEDGNGRISRLLLLVFFKKIGANLSYYISYEGLICYWKLGYNDSINESMVHYYEENCPMKIGIFQFYLAMFNKSFSIMKNLISIISKDTDYIKTIEYIRDNRYKSKIIAEDIVSEININGDKVRDILKHLSEWLIIGGSRSNENEYLPFGVLNCGL